MVDLDHFKPVNDQFGHQAGDAVLIEVARRIQEPIAFEGVMLSVGASIGMAFAKKIGINPRVLLKAADQVLYKVKQSGRNAASF